MKQPADQYYFMVPVWGERYVEMFLKYVLPSHFAHGNLPSIPPDKCTYHLFTRKEDLKQLNQSQAFARLNTLTRVVVDTFEPVEPVYNSTTECYNAGMDACKNRDVAFVFICPDCIYGNNSFANMHRLQSQGKRAIMVGSARVLREEFLPLMDDHLTEQGSVLDVPHRTLMRLMYDNLHPFAVAHICKRGMNYSPQLFFWEVEDQGLLAHCFHLHPLMIRPVERNHRATVTVDDDFLFHAVPDFADVYLVDDSDEICFVDATPLKKLTGGAYAIFDVAETRKWAATYADNYHRKFFKTPIRLHCGDLSETWTPHVRQAGTFVQQILQDLPRTPVERLTPAQPRISLPGAALGQVKRLLKMPARWAYRRLVNKLRDSLLSPVGHLHSEVAMLNTHLNYLRTKLDYLEREKKTKQSS